MKGLAVGGGIRAERRAESWQTAQWPFSLPMACYDHQVFLYFHMFEGNIFKYQFCAHVSPSKHLQVIKKSAAAHSYYKPQLSLVLTSVLIARTNLS